MRNKKSSGLPVVGVSALLTTFAVLCLTVFALLSVSTVQADLRIAQTSRLAVTNYYAADCQAQQILARLRAGETVDGVERDGNRCRYVCSIGGNEQQLAVEVVLDGTDYQIVQWQVRPTQPWTDDESIPVWDGEKEG